MKASKGFPFDDSFLVFPFDQMPTETMMKKETKNMLLDFLLESLDHYFELMFYVSLRQRSQLSVFPILELMFSGLSFDSKVIVSFRRWLLTSGERRKSSQQNRGRERQLGEKGEERAMHPLVSLESFRHKRERERERERIWEKNSRMYNWKNEWINVIHEWRRMREDGEEMREERVRMGCKWIPWRDTRLDSKLKRELHTWQGSLFPSNCVLCVWGWDALVLPVVLCTLYTLCTLCILCISSWLSSCICVCVSCAWLLEMRSLFSFLLLLCDSLPVFFFMASFVFGFFSRREGNRRRDMQYLLSLIPLDGYRLRPSFSSNNTSSAISLQYFNSLYRTRECFMCLVMQVKRRKEEREPFFSKFVREGNSILLVLLFLFLLMSLLRYASVARLKNALLW